MLFIGIKDGYWESLEASPLGAGQAPAHLPPVAAVQPASSSSAGPFSRAAAVVAPPSGTSGAGSSGDGARVPVALSNDQVNELRMRANNSIDLGARVLANEMNGRIMQGIRVVTQPFRVAFQRGQTMVKTQRGTVQLFTERAFGGTILQTCVDSATIFMDGPLPQQLGFLDPDTVSPMKSLTEEDETVGSLLLVFWASMVGRHLLQNMQCSHSVPGVFLLLRHDDRAVVQKTLSYLQRLWTLIQESDAIALTDNYAKARLRKAVPMSWPWIREQFIILSAFEFKHPAQEVVEATLELFRGGPSTLLVENGFNQLSAKAEVGRRQDLSRKMRWQSLVTSALSSDFDRAQVPRTTASRAATSSTSIPGSIFENDATDNRFGMDTLAAITTNKTWCSPSPES